jgi:hypothetical protein
MQRPVVSREGVEVNEKEQIKCATIAGMQHPPPVKRAPVAGMQHPPPVKRAPVAGMQHPPPVKRAPVAGMQPPRKRAPVAGYQPPLKRAADDGMLPANKRPHHDGTSAGTHGIPPCRGGPRNLLKPGRVVRQLKFNQKLSWSSIRLKAEIEQKMMKESKDLPICPLPVELKPEFLPCCA